MSETLHLIAIVCLIIGGLSASIIVIDFLTGHRQQMWIMDLVWPISGLYAGPLALWAYFTIGRLSTKQAVEEAKTRGEDPPIVGNGRSLSFR